MEHRPSGFGGRKDHRPAGHGGRFSRIEKATTLHANNFLIKRMRNLVRVRKFALFWVFSAVLLIVAGYVHIAFMRPLYSHVGPKEGGNYIEGMSGQVDTLNPIFATSAAERSVSKLLFSGLLKVDEKGSFAGDLAESWTVDQTGKVYTINIRPNAVWSDGVKVTSKDVVYTVEAMQNKATRSPYAAAWQNVAVEPRGDKTVVITLNAPYSPFTASLTTGILPQHALEGVMPQQLRQAAFSTRPKVSSGPFTFKTSVQDKVNGKSDDIYLSANERYVLGKPKLDRYTARVYKDSDMLAKAMHDREIMAASDVPSEQLSELRADPGLTVEKLRPFNAVYAFFKTTNPPFDDPKLRKGLLLAVDRQKTAEMVGGADKVDGPLVPGQLGYTGSARQADYDKTQSEALLKEAGWQKDSSGILSKNGKQLSISVVTIASDDYRVAATQLQKYWADVGVKVNLDFMNRDNFQSNVITPHAYDVLVYEISLGRDSDGYAYWHSSQAEPGRLNLSEYKSSKVDEALNSGRTRSDTSLREVKYRAFAQQWIADTPAIALYRPNSYYVQLNKLRSVKQGDIGDVVDRLAGVQYWTAEDGWLDNTR